MGKFKLWPFFGRTAAILTKEQNDEWIALIEEMEQACVQSEIDYEEAVERLSRAKLAIKKGQTSERHRELNEAMVARESFRNSNRSIHEINRAVKEACAQKLEHARTYNEEQTTGDETPATLNQTNPGFLSLIRFLKKWRG